MQTMYGLCLSKEGLSTMIKMTSGGELYRIHFHNNHSLLLTVLITVVPPVLLQTQNEVSSFYLLTTNCQMSFFLSEFELF